MNEEEVKEIEFKISLEGLVLYFFSTPEWLKIVDENPETYAKMADEVISSSLSAKSYKDLPKWMYDTLDKMGALVSEEESAQKSMDDWNPNE